METEYSESELLSFAISNGMIDMLYVRELKELAKNQEYLNKHPYRVWQGENNGFWYTYLPTVDGRKLKKRTTRLAIEKDIIDFWKSKEMNPTIEEVFNEWNDRRMERGKIAKSTHLRNKQIFKRHYSKFGRRKIRNVTSDEISDFLEDQISEHSLTAKAFANLKGITRGLLRRAKKLKYIDFNIEEMLDDMDVSDRDFVINVKEDIEEVFSEDEMPVIMDYLVDHIEDIRCLAIYLIFVTGIRVGEAVTLKHSDFDEDGFNIRRTETRYTVSKSGMGAYIYDVKDFPKTKAGLRMVVLPTTQKWLLKLIESTNPYDEYVFMENGERLHTAAIRRKLKRICDHLKLFPKSPHKIRKTYGSILLDNGIDNQMVIQQMGHTNITTTECHYHRNRRSNQKKAEILSGIAELSIPIAK